MEKLTDFVSNHMNDDTARLILDRSKWPGIDMELAVNCIESRRKLRGKVQEWHENPGLIFPAKLSAEQCSSSSTATYKASLASHIINSSCTGGTQDKPGLKTGWKLADLTGGLGVDSWFFSKAAGEVLYCEIKKELCMAAKHNFSMLGTDNITVVNCAVTPSSCLPSDRNAEATSKSPAEILETFRPDIIYMDPARRSGSGKKVFLLEDCTPDVLTLTDELFIQARHILLKLSPMADITMAGARLGRTCREVHAVSYGGECKELLIWLDREWSGGYSITACELHGKDKGIFTFHPEEEKNAVPAIAPKHDFENPGNNLLLFEPGKALMKSGAFNLMSERLGLRKIGRSTHYYIMDASAFEHSDKFENLGRLGKFFRIINCSPLDKRSIKEAGASFPDADVTARNIPMDTEALRKKLSANVAKASGTTKSKRQGCQEEQETGTQQKNQTGCQSESIHIFGLKSDTSGNLLLVTSRTIVKHT